MAAAAAAPPPLLHHHYHRRPPTLLRLLPVTFPRLLCSSQDLSAQLPPRGLAVADPPLRAEDLRGTVAGERVPLPNLTAKEKKELASYAHSLGKKLKSQQVGKSGVTPSVAASFVENLESNELLKIKVHGNCPADFADAVTQLEEATGSVAISQVGRSVILYRPSTTKMKKKEEQAAREMKVWKPKPRSPPPSSRMQKDQLPLQGSRRTTASSAGFRRRSS